MKKANPRELNPYLKDGGSGYLEETGGSIATGDRLLSSSIVGDGGASWRLKALKRAREPADREGRKLDEVFSCAFLVFCFDACHFHFLTCYIFAFLRRMMRTT
jgi:hypothetical protein